MPYGNSNSTTEKKGTSIFDSLKDAMSGAGRGQLQRKLDESERKAMGYSKDEYYSKMKKRKKGSNQ